jgi:hypothetical protein
MMAGVQPSQENARKLADYFSATFGKDKILICPLKRSGTYYFDEYEKFIRGMKFPFPPYEKREIEPEGRDAMKGEVRRIITSVHGIEVPEIKYIVLFDDSIKSGKTMLGALAWALENKETLDFEKIYVTASLDLLGMSHFAVDMHHYRLPGPIEIMRHGVPEEGVAPFPVTLKRLEERGLLSAIADVYTSHGADADSKNGKADGNGKDYGSSNLANVIKRLKPNGGQ